MDILFQIESHEIFKSLVQEIISNLYFKKHVQSTQIEFHEFQSAKDNIKTIIIDSDFDTTKIYEILNNKGWQPERVTYFLSVLENQKTNLLCAALNHYNNSYGPTLEDFDWLLKFVLGTSELKTSKSPLLQLILSILDKDGDQKKVLYDINKVMLLKVIDVLENISANQYISVSMAVFLSYIL